MRSRHVDTADPLPNPTRRPYSHDVHLCCRCMRWPLHASFHKPRSVECLCASSRTSQYTSDHLCLQILIAGAISVISAGEFESSPVDTTRGVTIDRLHGSAVLDDLLADVDVEEHVQSGMSTMIGIRHVCRHVCRHRRGGLHVQTRVYRHVCRRACRHA